MAGGGGWWANPLQTLSHGLVLTLRFTFDPELDNIVKHRTLEKGTEILALNAESIWSLNIYVHSKPNLLPAQPTLERQL